MAKKYEYFISYRYKKGMVIGYGHIILSRTVRIRTVEDFKDVESFVNDLNQSDKSYIINITKLPI